MSGSRASPRPWCRLSGQGDDEPPVGGAGSWLRPDVVRAAGRTVEEADEADTSVVADKRRESPDVRRVVDAHPPLREKERLAPIRRVQLSRPDKGVDARRVVVVVAVPIEVAEAREVVAESVPTDIRHAHRERV